MFHRFWSPPNLDLTQENILSKALAEATSDFVGSGSSSNTASRLFSDDDVKRIMEAASSQEMKDLLKETTQQAVEKGAFGAPWFWVTNSAGISEPFFGSDRYGEQALDPPSLHLTDMT
jgi:2-hydroxychromene-2-carboxylate isomerase